MLDHADCNASTIQVIISTTVIIMGVIGTRIDCINLLPVTVNAAQASSNVTISCADCSKPISLSVLFIAWSNPVLLFISPSHPFFMSMS